MKRQRTIYLLYILLFLSFGVSGQTRLQDSQQFSSEQHVYKLSRNNLQKLYKKGNKPDESMLHTFVTKCPYTKNFPHIPDLPRGNYMVVKASGPQLSYTEYVVDDFDYKLIPDESIRLFLHDSCGNVITDAQVKWGKNRLKYDAQSQTYVISKISDEAIVEVNNKGVYHYLEFNEKYNRYSFKEKGKRRKNSEESDQGFIVFSKPRYKPGERVKLKGYVTDSKGKPYEQDVNLKISYDSYTFKYDTVLTRLSPYRPGMFEYQFDLTDSLGLQLDRRYTVTLAPLTSKASGVEEDFEYEEYELKGLEFNVVVDKTLYGRGDSVKVNFKVADENKMPMYDGRVELKLKPRTYSAKLTDFGTAFLPEILLEETIQMIGASEKEYIIPDSVFPKEISSGYLVECTFLSADNEKYEQSVTFDYEDDEYKINVSQKKWKNVCLSDV